MRVPFFVARTRSIRIGYSYFEITVLYLTQFHFGDEKMDWHKILKVISNTIYSVGIVAVLCMTATALFGPNVYDDPTSMDPLTWRERAFYWLVLGAVPMLLACMAVYRLNDIKNSSHKKRNFILIFLPEFVCAACVLVVVGEIIRSTVLHI